MLSLLIGAAAMAAGAGDAGMAAMTRAVDHVLTHTLVVALAEPQVFVFGETAHATEQAALGDDTDARRT